MKNDIDRLLAQAHELQTRSLVEEDKGIETMRMEMPLLENLKRIHAYLSELCAMYCQRTSGVEFMTRMLPNYNVWSI